MSILPSISRKELINIGVTELTNIVFGVDVVGVFDAESFQQVFSAARPMRAFVRKTSRTMEHPVESGVLVPDHRIINAVEIEMSMTVSAQYYASAYQEMVQLFQDGTLLTVQTRADVYQNIFIADMPHDEDADMYDMITIGLHLRELLIADTEDDFAPADDVNNSTASLGTIQPTPDSSPNSSASGLLPWQDQSIEASPAPLPWQNQESAKPANGAVAPGSPQPITVKFKGEY